MKKLFIGAMSLMLLTTTIGVSATYPSQPAVAETQEIAVEALTASETKTVQTKLKRWGYYTGAVDGIYGPKTRAAVISFQRKNGLVADGIVGPKTAAAIGITLRGTNQNTNSNSDLYLLARCVHAEARGETYQGQVAVAYSYHHRWTRNR